MAKAASRSTSSRSGTKSGGQQAAELLREEDGSAMVTGSEPSPESDQAVADASGEELLEKLKRAEARIKELDEKLRDSDAAGRAVRHEKQPFAGELGGYQFEVTPSARTLENFPHLKPVVVSACDESEAKRWYLATNETRPGSNKMLDATRVHLSVVCKDKRRAKLIQHAQRVAYIRQRLESGQTLNARDQEYMDAHENEILKFDG
jgi:hypothetical protein